ncbi:MAG: trypsin-like peptidase domain-containing protein, partial [Planctomycetales bacterium]|nr:trypsin-like peptidase domain-containing protein [Planctomycetales bacterium]
MNRFLTAVCLTLALVAGADRLAAQDAAAADREDQLRGQMLSPKAFRAAAARVMPSVVTIESFGGVATGSQKGSIGGIRRPGDGPTTGLIVSPDGYVLTSTFNFIRQQPIITVVLHDGTRHVAKLLGRDEIRKLCVLKIDDVEGLPVAEVAPADGLRVGQWAISVGVGYGDTEPAISAGIISALGRAGGKAVQTDANISPANYGGPLLDIQGRIIGVCVPLNPKSPEVAAGVEWYDSGIGFAIPLDGAATTLTAMKEGKIVQPALLGVQVADDDEAGVVVKKVQPNTAAAKAGIEEGDRILSIAGQEATDAGALRRIIGQHVAGDKVEAVISRKEMKSTLEITLGAAEAKQAPDDQPKVPFKLPLP